MSKGKLFCFVSLLLLLLASCIKRYDPNITNLDAVKYVVTGGVYKGMPTQIVTITQTTPIATPKFEPVDGCVVTIIEGNGNTYLANCFWNGKYEAIIPENELVPGNKFKVDILVNGGTHIVSDFDQIQDCPEVDSVYYLRKDIPTSNPHFPTKGIQFYADFNSEGLPCRNYRFEAVETWEYTANFAPPFLRTCWVTSPVRSVFTLTTTDQTQNIYKLYPLYFVDNYSSQRLRYMYSMLFSQYSLSDAAYTYWEKMRLNFSDQGGLYENQPEQIEGNLHNLSDPTQKVLGFFSASTRKSKRIFVSHVPGLLIEYYDCPPVVWPEILNPECEDCMAKVGGTNIKPSFWP